MEPCCAEVFRPINNLAPMQVRVYRDNGCVPEEEAIRNSLKP